MSDGNIDRNTNIVACFLILMRRGEVLLLKRANTGYRDGEYGLVAGHVEAGETFTQAMLREAREEVGLELSANDLEVVHVMHRKSLVDQSERVDVYFKARQWQLEPHNCEPGKCTELKWSDLNELPENTVPSVRFALSQFKEQYYSEWGWGQ
jgi:8-oxo-dGTP pyrophosphatase MutT (NUDIX family)